MISMDKLSLRLLIERLRWIKKNPIQALERLCYYENVIERQNETIRKLRQDKEALNNG
ncbi:hypothetical protein NRS6186_10325 [Bacillus subtilis]|nr:hypothetical protein BSHJ0_02222 [Bacillus subtilis]CAF1727427.1 hypothetical protein NRS6099_01086 [Bacillus subtilis]CAF1790853.1 hypothetical protein NRS6132_00180 [Bacillus subtilis]CAF1792875.1 hypothetical protein NRS6141_00001 [Bacillus subtilis]CAF1861040.1 hypothetical protein NRS6181_02244 [Bacillus subtilis]